MFSFLLIVTRVYCGPELEMRLYEVEEYQADDEYTVSPHSYATSDGEKRQHFYHRGVPYSFMRFCDTIKGFHLVSLQWRKAKVWHSLTRPTLRGALT